MHHAPSVPSSVTPPSAQDRGETLDVLTGLVLGAAAVQRHLDSHAGVGGGALATNTGGRVKVAQTIGRPVAAAGRFPGTLQAAFHCLLGADATPKLMQAGAQLARQLAVQCPATQLVTLAPQLLSGLVKVLRHESLPNGLRPEQPEAVSMRAFSSAPSRRSTRARPRCCAPTLRW